MFRPDQRAQQAIGSARASFGSTAFTNQRVAHAGHRRYDNSGNAVHGYHRVGTYSSHGTLTVGQEEETRSYYSAEDRLVAMQKYDVRRTGEDDVTGTIYYKHAGVWEEYRYDPLGSRILVRARGDGGMCEIDS